MVKSWGPLLPEAVRKSQHATAGRGSSRHQERLFTHDFSVCNNVNRERGECTKTGAPEPHFLQVKRYHQLSRPPRVTGRRPSPASVPAAVGKARVVCRVPTPQWEAELKDAPFLHPRQIPAPGYSVHSVRFADTVQAPSELTWTL